MPRCFVWLFSQASAMAQPMRCRMMVDKITTVPKTKLGAQVGRLDDDDEDMARINQAITVFLGLAVTPWAGRRRKKKAMSHELFDHAAARRR